MPLPPLPTVPSSALHLGSSDFGTGTARRYPLMSRPSAVENSGQTIPSSPAVLHELATGFPFKPALNGLEDTVMKEN